MSFDTLDISSFDNEENVKIQKSLSVLDELKDFIPPLVNYERELLKEDIEKNGVKDPIEYVLIKRKPIIIDGHNRFSIIQELNLPFYKWSVSLIPIKNIEDIKIYMLKKQLGRRNISDSARDDLIGRLYNNNKKTRGNIKGQAVTSVNVAEEIAKKENISSRSVKRKGNYSKGLDILEKDNPIIRKQIHSGKCKLTKKEVEDIGRGVKGHAVTSQNTITQEIHNIVVSWSDKRNELVMFLQGSDPITIDKKTLRKLTKDILTLTEQL